MNHEGYSDPTADTAVRKADWIPDQPYEYIMRLKNALWVLGYDLNSIEISYGGREYKKEWRRQ